MKNVACLCLEPSQEESDVDKVEYNSSSSKLKALLSSKRIKFDDEIRKLKEPLQNSCINDGSSKSQNQESKEHQSENDTSLTTQGTDSASSRHSGLRRSSRLSTSTQRYDSGIPEKRSPRRNSGTQQNNSGIPEKRSPRRNSSTQRNDNIVPEKSPRLNNSQSYVCVDPWKDDRKSKVNGIHVPFACDTSMSLLKLAYKLKLARERLQTKSSLQFKTNGLNGNKSVENNVSQKIVSISNGTTESQKIPSVPKPITVLNVQTNKEVITATDVQVPKPAVTRIEVHMPKPTVIKTNVQLPKPAATVNQVNAQVSKAPETIVEIKPIKLPTIPKEAIQMLSSFKMGDNKDDDTEMDLSCANLPLWPVLGAAKDAALKMDTSYLNKFVPPKHCDNKSSRQSSACSTKKTNNQNNENQNESSSIKPEEKELDLESLNVIPEALDEDQMEAVLKIAVSTVLKANLPKTAKRAYEIARLSVDASRKAINQSIIQHRVKPDSNRLQIVNVEDLKKDKFTASSVVSTTPVLNLPSVNSKSNIDERQSGLSSPNSATPVMNSKYTVSLLKDNNLLKSPASTKPSTMVPVKINTSQVASGQLILVVKDVNPKMNSLELVTSNVSVSSTAVPNLNTIRVQKIDSKEKTPASATPVNAVSILKKFSMNTPEIQKDGNVTIQNGAGHNKSSQWPAIVNYKIGGDLNSSGANDDSKKIIIPRRYHCSQCEYQTDNRSHLRRHESSVHSGDKMYRCYVCKKEFARSEKCRSHIVKIHPEVDYDPKLIRKEKYQQLNSNKQQRQPSPSPGNKVDSSQKKVESSPRKTESSPSKTEPSPSKKASSSNKVESSPNKIESMTENSLEVALGESTVPTNVESSGTVQITSQMNLIIL